MEEITRKSAITETSLTELEVINNQLSGLNNLAVDINARITQFNDRVQGCVPRNCEATGAEKAEDSRLNGIKETIGYLQNILNEINSESLRLENIG